MEPQLNERLTKLEEKVDAIHQIVLKTRKVQKTAGTVRLLYWVFIILLGFGAFYFIKPFMAQLGDMYGIGNSGDSQYLNQFLNQVNGAYNQ
jgi:hypothetical protein